MLTNCFLGANTKDGFFSLYASFPPENAYLHVIKGGPGTGKSGFMRAVKNHAEALGHEVEAVLCSGDPASLDGIYIPALRLAWVDGTAPHCLDPRCFGVNGDYVDLSRFCHTPLAGADRSEASALTIQYKEEYSKAYSFLSCAAALKGKIGVNAMDEARTETVRKRIRRILAQNKPQERGMGGERHVFLSAISCAGIVRLEESITTLCKHIYRFDSTFGLDTLALPLVSAEADRRGLGKLVCHSPLVPQELDAVLLPECSLAFVSDGWCIRSMTDLHPDALLPSDTRMRLSDGGTEALRLHREALSHALAHLRAAKELHDELEKIYGRNTDFPALSAFTHQQLALLG